LDEIQSQTQNSLTNLSSPQQHCACLMEGAVPGMWGIVKLPWLKGPVRLTIDVAFMYSEDRRIVRVNPGLASLKEVQEMRKQRTTVSLGLARTLSACYEGSSFSIWRENRLERRLPDQHKVVCERTLPQQRQIDALSMIPARSGTH
jgi:hypothetical protein